jgi:hypothetical protein
MAKAISGDARIKYWRSVSQTNVASFFQVNQSTVMTWRDAGCPWDAESKRFDLFEVHKWLVARAEKKPISDESLSKAKTRVEITRIEAQIDKLRGATIPKEQHSQALKDMALSFKAFCESAINRNYQAFTGIHDAHEAHAILKGFWSELLKRWGYTKPKEESDGEPIEQREQPKVEGAGKDSTETDNGEI